MPPRARPHAHRLMRHEHGKFVEWFLAAGALQEPSLSFNTICVIGLGYIGLPTASTLAGHGASVLGVDVNERVLGTLRRGEIHIHEQGLREMYR